jgi:predicted transcriptional regulator
MSGRKNFDELRHKLRSDAGARVKVDQYRHVMKDALALADLREERRVTQQEIADKLGISQPNISRVEHQEDVYLSTLRGYVDALGGHLEVRAVFSDQMVTLDVPASQAG